MTRWEPDSRNLDNYCPCESLEEHLRLCDVREPCLLCDAVSTCPIACSACRKQLALLRLLRTRNDFELVSSP